jgi:multidrug efflux pump
MIQARQSASFQAMRDKATDLVKMVESDPHVPDVVAFTSGQSGTPADRMFAALKDFPERKSGAPRVIGRIRKTGASEPGVSLVLQPVPDIRVRGRRTEAGR